ncbi:MAG: amino acid permease [Actinomycetota bacterium]
MVVGNMIGSGVFLLPAALAGVALVYGSSALLAWVVTGVGAMLLAGVFATMGRAYPKTGGPYAYARRAFGDFVGFQTAWGYWIAAWVGNAAIATAFVGYTTVVWPGLADSNLAMALLAVGSIWLLTFVNILGVREGGRVQVATTILKFVPLALIAVIGLFSIDTAHFTPFLEATGSTGRNALTLLEGITAAVGLTLWAFIGLESATVPAEEVKDPGRTIPRATYLGTAVTTLIYIVATSCPRRCSILCSAVRSGAGSLIAPNGGEFDVPRPCGGRAPPRRAAQAVPGQFARDPRASQGRGAGRGGSGSGA